MKQKAKQVLGLLLMSMMVFSTITPAWAARAEVICSECGDHEHTLTDGDHQKGQEACTDASCNHDHDEDVTIGNASASSISKSLAQKQAACNHTWKTVTTKQPTCGTAGTYVTKCSKCGAGSPNGNGTIPATGKHNWSLQSTTNATCTANGSRKYRCTGCGQTKTETINKLGHSFRTVTTKQPTCGTAGAYESRCSRCNAGSSSGNGTIPATGNHNWSLTSTTNPTCTANGSRKYTCTVCKQTKTESIAKLGHDFKQVTTKQPTCGAGGTYETKCTRCGIGSSTGNGTIPATGNHTWDRSAPTCTAAKKCTVCGAIGQNALGHDYKTVTTKQPNCGVGGTYETKCTRCGIGSPNGNGTIPATGNHTWVYTSTTNPTCTANGYKLYTCSVCKQTKKETITKLGHDFKQVTTKQPTCGTAGAFETKCTRCGIGSSTGNGEIPATGNHNWSLTSTTNPTCTANGSKKYTCTVCKQTKTETIAKLGHDYRQVTTKKPTCGKAGNYETKCSRCGIGSPNGNGEIPATGKHTWNLNASNCTTDKVCTECGKVGEVAKGHDWVLTSSEVGALGKGQDSYKCSRCKATQTLEHNYQWVVTQLPGNCQSGSRVYMCVNQDCGHVLGGESIQNYEGHDFLPRNASNCTKKCKNCGYVEQSHDFYKVERAGSVANTIEEVKICRDCGTEWIVKVRQTGSGQGGQPSTQERNNDAVIISGSDSLPGLTQVSFPKDARNIESNLNNSEIFNGNVSRYEYDETTKAQVLNYIDEVSCFVYTGHGTYSGGSHLAISDDIEIYAGSLANRDLSNLDLASVLVCYTAQGTDDYDDNPYNGSVAYAFCEQGALVSIGCVVPINNNFSVHWENEFFRLYPQIIANAETIEDKEARDDYVKLLTCCLAMSVTDTVVREEISNLYVEYRNNPTRRSELENEFLSYKDNIVIFTNENGQVGYNTLNNDTKVGFTYYPALYDVNDIGLWTMEDYMEEMLDMYTD